MGAHLALRHGADMVVLGFAMHNGQYTAIETGKGLKANGAEVPKGEVLEALCHATEAPRFVLDLRRANAVPKSMRSIGAVATRMQFSAVNIAHDFDAIMFVDHTNATQLMHPSK